MTLLAVVDGLRELVADPTQLEVDESGAEPFDWREGTLYAYALPTARQSSIETGPTVREDFDVTLVVVGRGAGEEPTRERSRDLSDELADWQQRIHDRVRANASNAVWAFAQARTVIPPRSLKARAIAVQVTGYRILS